ncbi:SprT family protein [Lacticigenium naphthae]|uniref:SprT family protein n=1 Tax=Lacticigenium naphthae TaxID=515351 RepID=UPI0004177C06|nr:SprT family protein [Lacticigenium naphthae]
MDDRELQNLVEFTSIHYFKKEFLHEAFFNKRLRTTGGRYHLHSHDLDFNPLVYDIYGLNELIKVIKHELCHYHLHLEGKGYLHRDVDFKKLLIQTGGSRHVPSLVKREGKYRYQCQDCGSTYERLRKMNVQKYVCGKCSGELKLQIK